MSSLFGAATSHCLSFWRQCFREQGIKEGELQHGWTRGKEMETHNRSLMQPGYRRLCIHERVHMHAHEAEEEEAWGSERASPDSTPNTFALSSQRESRASL